MRFLQMPLATCHGDETLRLRGIETVAFMFSGVWGTSRPESKTLGLLRVCTTRCETDTQ